MATITAEPKPTARSPRGRATKPLCWQGFSLQVPEDWDLTGFSGTAESGYFRADDGTELGCEIKWVTIGKRAKAPEVTVRAEAFIAGLERTAKKKKMAFDGRIVDAPRGVERPDRQVAGFTWTGDRKAIGAVWFCATTQRVVIAQVLGHTSGRGGLTSLAESILSSLENKDRLDGQRRWALYDLDVTVPSDFLLVGQQLMNVYLKLSFARTTHRLTIEQWSAANVARKGAFLDLWFEANARGELSQARFKTEESELHGHPAIRTGGGPAFGQPMLQVLREVAALRWPATQFSSLGWECEHSNKLYLVQAMRPRRDRDLIGEVARQLHCHDFTASEVAT